jgi:2',3'-cyclic-nucleotide 2'-phosphodiesterase (5'-nucleotidase family)
MSQFEPSRRSFISATGAWLGASALGFSADGLRAKTISIFHTTDLHGHLVPTRSYTGINDVGGFARCATCIRQWRKESPDSLLVDIGDVYQGSAASFVSRGALMMRLFNRLGYDAWTLGNHDFDWGPEVLEGHLKLSKADVLTSNLERGGKFPGGGEGAWKSVKPWTIKEVGGFRIALIGLITPGLPFWLTPETLGGISPTDPVVSLKRSIAEVKAEKADAIVLMAHMGWRLEDDFANPVREILKDAGVDVFLAGHTHQDQSSWEMSGALCSQASYHGIHCGRVDLTFDLEKRKIVTRRAFTLLMDQRFELDPVVMEMALPEIKEADAQMSRKLGKVVATIGGVNRGNRLSQVFCEFFSEALRRNQTPVDGVFHGTFGTGDVAIGELSVADCWRMLPYENLLITAEVTAEELIEIVQEDMDVKNSDRLLWPFEMVFDGYGRVIRLTHQGELVAAGKRFTVAFNSYDGQSAGRQLMRLREIVAQSSAKRTVTTIDTRGALIDGILNRKEIF